MESKTRCLLHRNDLKDFTAWLVTKGFEIHTKKGFWEELRAKKNNKWLIIFDRLRGDHFTVPGDAVEIVRHYYLSKKVHEPAPSGVSAEDLLL